MPQASELRKGQAIKYKGEPVIVEKVEHRTPGNLRAFVQAILRSLRTGKSMDVRFSSTEKVERVDTTRQKLEFSYSDPQGFHFMDPVTFETHTFQKEFVGDAADFMMENCEVEIRFIEGRASQLELPASVVLKVIESAEGLRGDTASNVQKPATLETGKIIQVPLFIKEEERIKVDTRTGDYMGRA